jgi:tetratricopeptide (TPR) repeat protein
MSDPLRFDRATGPADAPDCEREARIEELLLAGLDQYFAGQYELAINVWTRVLFLDRGHARARAYIERARSAISERQREGEELLHTGADAFSRGDAGAARRLVTSAVERGASGEEALALLQRIDRLEAARGGADPRGLPRTDRRSPLDSGADPQPRGDSRLAWIGAGLVIGVLLAAAAGTYLWANGGQWLRIDATANATGTPRPEEPLPVPAAAEVWLARARAHYLKGRLHDALDALDAIGPEDRVRGAADELRSAIQRELLASARGGESSPDAAATAGRR